jgi:chitinase
MAEPGAGNEYCSWDGPNETPVCNSHHYEEGLIYLAHQAGAEVYPSIGGWSLSDPFPTMAANEEYRANFVSQCISLIKNYNFDGIDIDWEVSYDTHLIETYSQLIEYSYNRFIMQYPGYEPHSGTPNDGESWNLLLNDLRAALDELEEETGHYYGITA